VRDCGDGAEAGGATEQRIAVLREEIRRAGEFTCRVRVGTAFWAVGVLVGLPPIGFVALWCVLARDHLEEWLAAWVDQLLGVLVVATLLTSAALAIALIAGRCQRWCCRGDLRRRMFPIEPSIRASVLLELRRDQVVDTRELARGLLREFGLASEVTPGQLAGGRGDEASAAERGVGAGAETRRAVR
jgi:hypothetical protein